MEKSINKYFDICIIGGGAAGMVAGIAAARKNPSLSVVIVEKMESTGKKVAAAGNGRCNLSNVKSPDWEKTSAFFSSLGLITRIDEEGRVYPHSEDGRDVAACLFNEAESLRIKIITRQQVSKIDRTEDAPKEAHDSERNAEDCPECDFTITASFNKPKAHHAGPEDADITISAKKVLIATGGKSKPKLGTSGEGFTLAKSLGHSIRRLRPVLTGVETEEDIKALGLSGIREKCAVSLYKNENMVFSDRGEIQFADYGISGIIVFDMTRFMDLEDGDKDGFKSYHIEIDFLPDFDEHTIRQMLEERISATKKKAARKIGSTERVEILPDKVNMLCSWVKAPIAKVILENSNTEDEIINSLKNFDLHPTNLKGWDMAQVTRGGIPLGEIDEATGESKLVKGLYFAGEIIDEDFQCGGYSSRGRRRNRSAQAP